MPSGTPDYQRMQQDAEQRLREMQQRANRAVHSHGIPPIPNFVQMNPNRQNQPSHQNTETTHRQPQDNCNGHWQNSDIKVNSSVYEGKQQPDSKKGIFSRFSGLNILKALNFQNIHIDNDVLIIIALIFLLSSEDTDELLLLALVYIML